MKFHLNPEFFKMSKRVRDNWDYEDREKVILQKELDKIIIIDSKEKFICFINNLEKLKVDNRLYKNKYIFKLNITDLKNIKNNECDIYKKIINIFSDVKFLKQINILELNSEYNKESNLLIKEIFNKLKDLIYIKKEDKVYIDRYRVYKLNSARYRKLIYVLDEWK